MLLFDLQVALKHRQGSDYQNENTSEIATWAVQERREIRCQRIRPHSPFNKHK